MQEEKSKCRYVVAKVVSRCNLNCSYCYMYNLGDKTYLNQPKVMPDDVVEALLIRIRNHCLRNDLDRFVICFHGGEPLLAGKKFFTKFLARADAILKASGIQPYYALQTNAVLLDEEWCKFFDEKEISLSISVDGTKQAHDEFRVDHKGRGSYNRVARGLSCAQEPDNMKRPPAVLSVINLNADPVSLYYHFVNSLKVKAVDFLFPDANYDKLPVGKEFKGGEPYGDWLIKIFDEWFTHKGPSRPTVRLFSNILGQILGRNTSTDSMGHQLVEVLVVETNGGIEAVDVLKVCGHGFTKGTANVLTHEFEEAFTDELITMYERSHRMLCGKCLSCPIQRICGGGYLPHRYSSKNGFNNPSIYCNDILKLTSHIQNRLLDSFPQNLLEESNLAPMTYAELVNMIEAVPHESPYEQQLESFRIQ